MRYNRDPYNRSPYNRTKSGLIWLEPLHMQATGTTRVEETRVFYVRPNANFTARGIARPSETINVIYVTPEELKAASEAGIEYETTVSLTPGRMTAAALMERVEQVMRMYPSLETMTGRAEMEHMAARMERFITAAMTASASMDVTPALTIGGIWARMSARALLQILDENDDVFAQQVLLVDVTIEPGQTLVIDSAPAYTATLDGVNVIEYISSSFWKWFAVSPDSLRFVVDFDGSGQITAQVEYTEMWY